MPFGPTPLGRVLKFHMLIPHKNCWPVFFHVRVISHLHYFNPIKPNGISHHYQLKQSISVLRDVLWYEGGSICNENPFITPSANALGFYAICQTKDQSVAVIMVHEHYFILPNLISYRLFKKDTNIHCIYFPLNCKDCF